MAKIPANSKVRPSLEYLHQYTVKTVRATTNGFNITFENGAKVEIHDKATKVPDRLAGRSLVDTTFQPKKTIMRFGIVKRVGGIVGVTEEILVGVTPSKYKITDPRFEEAAWPQRSKK